MYSIEKNIVIQKKLLVVSVIDDLGNIIIMNKQMSTDQHFKL